MKLSQSLNDALNQQVLKEYQNQLIYKQIQSYFEDLQLKKLADYFAHQALDENSHASKFIDHINDRTGGKVSLGEVDFPQLSLGDVNSVGDVYIQVEESTSESIEELYDLALSEKSYMDLGFLEEMLNEQVSEENEAQEFATKLRNVKDLVLFDATFGE